MYPSYCSHCGVRLPSEISASNLDNYYRDFYEAGIYFNIECPHCEAEYTITPEDQETAIRVHMELFPYNEKKK